MDKNIMDKNIKIKICTKCLIEKPLTAEFFYYRKDRKRFDGVTCLECMNKQKRQYHKNNREKEQEYNKKWAAEHKDERREYNKKWEEGHKEKRTAYYRQYEKEHKIERKKYREEHKQELCIKEKKYREKNKDKIKFKRRKYKEENKNKIKERAKEYERKKRKNDPIYRLKKNIIRKINKFIRNRFEKEKSSFFQNVQYSCNEFILHLESQFEPWMSWDNYGPYRTKTWCDSDSSTWTWQIDHIIPHSMFHYTSMKDEEFKKCWSLENLRPYSAKQNLIDGVNQVRHL